MTPWGDAPAPHRPTGNGADRTVVALTADVLQLILDLAYEYEQQTGRKMTAPELADKLAHPGS